MEKIKKSEVETIRNIVKKRRKVLLPLIDVFGTRTFTQEEREDLRSILLEKIMENGLSSDGEPNEWGRQMDDLIGKLMWY
jgi:hypothetical protein